MKHAVVKNITLFAKEHDVSAETSCSLANKVIV